MGNKNHKYDIDLKFGEKNEDSLEKILRFGKIEVKTERDIWKTTGNIAIEIRYKGEPSGLSTTDSSVWIHLLCYKGTIEGGFIFSVPKLKEIIKSLLRDKIAHLKMGGDDNKSQLVLIPIKKIWDYQL